MALVGLAAAAVIGARAARRRSAGSAPADEAPIAPDAPVSMPVAPAPEAVAATAGPAVDAPIDPVVPTAAVPPVEDGSDTEPNPEELAAAQLAVLAILSQEGRLETDRTALGVATTLEREATDVAALLRALHKQGHVAGDEYTATGEKIWFVTDAGTARLD